MKVTLIALALMLQMNGVAADDPAAAPQHFRYQRTIAAPAAHSGQACVVLDAAVFAHASSESLDDMRLYAMPGAVETPFALSVSGTPNDEDESAAIENLGTVGLNVVFDAIMPSRPYSSITLDLAATNFIGSVEVTGLSAAQAAPVVLGRFAIFDLTAQHLSRSTTLPLQELNFPRLHFSLHLQPAPGTDAQHFTPAIVTGLTVPPTREAQTLFTTVAVAPPFTIEGRDSVAVVKLPSHVPIDRVFIRPQPSEHANFLRDVTITAAPEGSRDASARETARGEISHVKLPAATTAEQGSELSDNFVDTPFAANLKHAATLRIEVHNGDDTPLPLMPAQIQMRQRKLCFDASAASYTLRYGDPLLRAPMYDYARLFTPSSSAALLSLGPESLNPDYRPRPDTRPFSERHPGLLWVVLFAVIALLGSMALRSARSRKD